MTAPHPTNPILRWFRQGGMTRWIALGLIIGAVSGLGAAAFFYCLEVAKHFTFDYLSRYPMPSPAGERLFVSEATGPLRRWVFFLLPAVGGVISGLIAYNLAPEAEGDGTYAMIESFHEKQGRVRARVPLVKAVSSLITLASGGSAGREGPITQIGAGLGAWIADLLKLPARDRRLMLLVGAGGGLGAIFRAPLGGAVAACEVIYREDLETDALIPTIICSITSYIIFTHFFGFRPIFDIPRLTFHDPRQLAFYVVLGLVCVPLGVFYVRIFYFLKEKVFARAAIPNWAKPAIGGVAIGLIGLFYPQVYSDGWGHVQRAILGQLTLQLMFMIALFKIIATSFTIGSGGSGGVFGPTMMIGGMLGGTVGFVANHFFPNIVSQVDIAAFVLVGMAAFFAGVAHAPLGALLMVTEMTGGYALIAPLLLVSVTAIMFNRRWSIYKTQVKNKFHSPAHIGEFTVNVLEEMKVSDIFERKEVVRSIPAASSLGEVQQFLTYEDMDVWPVQRADGQIVGVLSLDSTRPILFEDSLNQVLIAEDMAIPAAHVHPDDSLYGALLEFLKYPIAGLLVVDPNDENKILGILHHKDLIRAYNNEIIRRKGK
jgi:CIC family chloride channel protein